MSSERSRANQQIVEVSYTSPIRIGSKFLGKEFQITFSPDEFQRAKTILDQRGFFEAQQNIYRFVVRAPEPRNKQPPVGDTGIPKSGLLSYELGEKFSSLINAHYRKIYFYFSTVCSDPETAADLVQTVFLRAYNAFTRFVPNPKLADPEKAWLFKIARNILKNHFRDYKRHRERDISLDDVEFIADNGNSPEDRYADSELKSELLKKINTLGNRHKVYIWLKFVQELTDREIGSIMGKTEQATKALGFRFRRKLQEDLQKE